MSFLRVVSLLGVKKETAYKQAKQAFIHFITEKADKIDMGSITSSELADYIENLNSIRQSFIDIGRYQLAKGYVIKIDSLVKRYEILHDELKAKEIAELQEDDLLEIIQASLCLSDLSEDSSGGYDSDSLSPVFGRDAEDSSGGYDSDSLSPVFVRDAEAKASTFTLDADHGLFETSPRFLVRRKVLARVVISDSDLDSMAYSPPDASPRTPKNY